MLEESLECQCLSWLAHGCSVGTDRVCGNVIMVGTWMLCGNDVIMVGTWMLCGNGWSLWERYHGWWEQMEFVGTLSWLGHGCSVGTDGVCGNVIMDALWERMESVGTLQWLGHGCSVGTDGVCGNVNMVGGNRWSLWERWLGHGCSVEKDGVCGNVIMVGPWMLCGKGWSLWERYHVWPWDAL